VTIARCRPPTRPQHRALEIYRVVVSPKCDIGAPETIILTGDAEETFVRGATVTHFNGIEATPDGRMLIVNSASGTLYSIDVQTGVSTRIDLGPVEVPTGDGTLLSGRTLYVLQNGNPPSRRNPQPDRGDPAGRRAAVRHDRGHAHEHAVRDCNHPRQARQHPLRR
jgi:hypothetical protein